MGLDDFESQSSRTDRNPSKQTDGELKGITDDAPVLPDTASDIRRGRELEFIVASKYASMGYIISFPLRRVLYDLSVQTESNIYTVQVKSTRTTRQDGNREYCPIHIDSHGDNKLPDEAYDYLVAYAEPRDNWYIIPEEDIKSSTKLYLHPEGKYSTYIDNW